jgi:hypothetical protein
MELSIGMAPGNSWEISAFVQFVVLHTDWPELAKCETSFPLLNVAVPNGRLSERFAELPHTLPSPFDAQPDESEAIVKIMPSILLAVPVIPASEVMSIRPG